ncbi:DUF5053 domain-containing protein [Dysgonomonas sp. 520]|uniref:DUF5053 domain-containing protein n=1 Tax=Dysgonomonas sp. 520 TaxID=2302931 RepID=UPI0013D38B27|nr:DUF5053 domain-containing protein [Dysgonomonas sp. 520]NDW10060.1 DUF5053 domain-containing protein [Dysgonomonas sp. 520]
MKLIDKLDKIKEYFTNSEVDKFKELVTEVYAEVSTEKEKMLIDEFIKNMVDESMEKSSEEVEILLIKAKLYEVEKIVSLSYIAKQYFNKSKEWLYQRINGYKVNGKKAKFTDDELKTLELALHDISKKLGSVTLV